MKRTTYNNRSRLNSNFAKQIKQIPLCDIVVTHQKSQVRQSGIIPSHAMAIANDIFRQGQLVPISVMPENNGQYETLDGNHRLAALQHLDKTYGCETENFKFVNCYIETGVKTKAEKILYQAAQNDHPPVKSNNISDISRALQDLQGEKDCPVEISLANFDVDYPDDWMEQAEQWLLKEFSLSKRERKKIIKGLTQGIQSTKIRNYIKSDAVDIFRKLNDIGWAGNKPGDESNGWILYPVSMASHIFPNVSGNGLKKKGDSPVDKIAVCVWDSNPLGKTGTQIDDYRRKVVKSINELNSNSLLKRSSKLVDKIYLMPQKLDGVENQDALYEVPVNGNGKFSLNLLPKKGW